MPSPDVTPYVDLELLDVDAQALAERAFLDARSKLPEWTPREGHTEAVLIEAMALDAAETVYALNRLPGTLTEVLLRLFGLTRDQGSPPSAEVLFTVADDAGYTIPTGTTVRLELDNGLEPLDLSTELDLVIPAGATSGAVRATGGSPTVEANGQPAGTPLGVLDAIPYVNGATLASAVAGGRLPEDGTAFLDRAVARLSRLTTTLVRPDDFEAYLAERPDVVRVRVLDLYNPATPSSAPGSAPGYVTVAVAGAGGAGLDSVTRATIASELRARAHAGLTVNVVNADVTTVPVTLTVLRYANVDDATVRANVVDAVNAYLNPDVWPFRSTLFVNELIGRVDAAAGVDVVLEVTSPADDLLLNGWAPLARAGAITVNVQAPA